MTEGAAPRTEAETFWREVGEWAVKEGYWEREASPAATAEAVVRPKKMSRFEEAGARHRDSEWGAMRPVQTEADEGLWSRERLADAYFAACYDRRNLILELDAARLVPALAASQPAPALDVERLAQALTLHRIRQRENGPVAYLEHACAGDCCPDIAAEYARLAQPSEGE